MKYTAVGAIELSSIVKGLAAEDALLKAAAVELLIARTICSGKYFILFAGSVSSVESAMETARRIGAEAVIDFLTVANVHPTVFPAMTQSVALGPDDCGSLGVIETFSGVSALVAADTAAKAANVTLFRLNVAMAMGGKGLLMLTGSVADVQAGIDAAVAAVAPRGLLVNHLVIPRPEKELFGDYI